MLFEWSIFKCPLLTFTTSTFNEALLGFVECSPVFEPSFICKFGMLVSNTPPERHILYQQFFPHLIFAKPNIFLITRMPSQARIPVSLINRWLLVHSQENGIHGNLKIPLYPFLDLASLNIHGKTQPYSRRRRGTSALICQNTVPLFLV